MYRVQYLRGDPGLFSGIGKAIGRVAKGVFQASPIGQGIAVARDIVSGGRNEPSNSRTAGPSFSVAPGNLQIPSQVAPGVPGMTVGVSPLGTIGVAGEQPRGYHRNKTTYFLKNGTRVPAGSKWVRNRRANPLNPRALKKGLHRAHAFAHIARAVIGFSSPRAPKGKVYFRRKRRSR